MKKKLAVMVSGGGTNFQAIIDAVEYGTIPNCEIALCISSNKDAYALRRAQRHGVKSIIVDRDHYPSMEERSSAIIKALDGEGVDLVILAGYMSVLKPEVINAYRNKIINIHPSLIPKFCGDGMYGIRVHKAVIEAGEKESGATVHFVDEGVDTGEIIFQEKVPVLEGDTPEGLAARVLKIEHKILPAAVAKLTSD